MNEVSDKLAPVTNKLATQTEVPDYLKADVGNKLGMENVTQDDMLIPRLCIAQEGNSPQLKKTSELYIPDLEPGQFFNSVTGEIYGNSVVLVPLFFFKNFIEFVPMDQGGGVVKMYQSKAEVPLADLAWVDNTKPKVTEFKNWMSLIIREDRAPEPIVSSFKSSGIKTAKKLGKLIDMTNLPAFAKTYTFTVKPKQKGQLSWFGQDVQPGEFVPRAFYDNAKSYFAKLQEAGVKVDLTGMTDKEGTDEPESERSPF